MRVVVCDVVKDVSDGYHHGRRGRAVVIVIIRLGWRLREAVCHHEGHHLFVELQPLALRAGRKEQLNSSYLNAVLENNNVIFDIFLITIVIGHFMK